MTIRATIAIMDVFDFFCAEIEQFLLLLTNYLFLFFSFVVVQDVLLCITWTVISSLPSGNLEIENYFQF